jgi:hypothetical protein
MKYFPLVFFFILLFGTAGSQNICDELEMMREGFEYEYTSYNKKDKITGVQRMKVLEMRKEGDAVISRIQARFFDKKEKEYQQFEYEFKCQDNTFYVDLRNALDPQMFASLSSSMEIEVSGIPSSYSGNIKVGDKLPDANMELEARSGGMKIMTMNVLIRDQEVLAKEDVQTPAGNFSCYKIASTSDVKAIFRETITAENWFSKKYGTVKSVNYDKKGKVSSYSLLTFVSGR